MQCCAPPPRPALAGLLQVLRMDPAEVHQVHQRVAQLAEHLNKRTIQVLQQLMPRPEDAYLAPPQAADAAMSIM